MPHESGFWRLRRGPTKLRRHHHLAKRSKAAGVDHNISLTKSRRLLIAIVVSQSAAEHEY